MTVLVQLTMLGQAGVSRGDAHVFAPRENPVPVTLGPVKGLLPLGGAPQASGMIRSGASQMAVSVNTLEP